MRHGQQQSYKLRAEKLFEAEKRRLAGVILELNNSNKRLKSLTADGSSMEAGFMPSGVSTVVQQECVSPHFILR